MVYCRIIPGVLYFSEGMSKFYILDAWSGPIGYGTSESIKPYLDILHNYNYKFKNESAVNPGLKIRGYLDGGITENFTNEYADSALGGMANIFGDKISDISQMTGSVYGTDLLNRAKNFIEPFITAAGNGVENLIGKGLTDRIGGMMGAGAEALKGFAGNLQSAIQNSAPGVYNAGHMALDVLNAAAGGQRFDFPAVWKASVFQPNYSILVRLVNEDPTNDLAYQTNIVGPLTALLLLALPQVRTEFSSSHSWPFFCKVDAPGLFSLPAAGISNITVTKGESADTISFNQRPLIIDVRIEFVNLFSILPMGLTGDTRERRLTLDRYIENMMGWNTYQSNVDKTNGKFTVESGLSNFKSGDIDEVRQFIHPGNESIDLAWSNEKLVLTQALQIQEKQKEEANKKWYDKIADAWKAAGSDWVGRQKEFMEGVGGSYDNMLDTIQTGTVANATGTEKQEKKMQGADTNSAVVSPDPDSSD
jgi:hypothetical protein